MQSYAEQFRLNAQARRGDGRSPSRYPEELRELALAHLAQVRNAGGMANQAVRDLGIDAATLRGWEDARRHRDMAGSASLVPVVVNNEPESLSANAQRYVIRGPHGVTIECRTAMDVAALVRALA